MRWVATLCYSTSYAGFECSLCLLLITRFCLIGCSTALAFPEYPCNSYLSNRSQRIALQGTLFQLFDLDCGVTQGSCLGPLLYVIYASKLFNIVERHLPDAHCYAGDPQLYLSFRPVDGLSSLTDAIQEMERCIEDIRNWMVSDRLLLNDEKTEFLLIGTHQQLANAPLKSWNNDYRTRELRKKSWCLV